MDFKELLLEADRRHQEAAKKSQLVKRINTNFTTPAMKEEKSSRPKSEAVQKLLDEKRREERRRREAEDRKKMETEKARQEREREEKRKNTFRIPKKTATEDAPSDAESFSSISSGDEPKLSSSSTAKPKTHLGVHKSSSSHGDSEKSHRSSSQSHRSSSSHRHSEKKDGHSHKTSERSSSSSHHSSKHRSGEHTSRGQGDHHSEKEKTKHHSDKYRHSSSGRHEPGSSKTHSNCEKEKSRGSFGSHSKTSEHGLHKNSRTEQKDSRTEQKDKCVIRDKAIIVAENESSGYVTSPDISSEEEGGELPASKPSLAKNHAHNTNMKESTESAGSVQRNNSTDAAEETVVAPVTLTRHHLKPTIDRTGGSVEERAKILEKLQAIRERMAENESSSRKRASWGDVKKRRAKREKLDGDFTGSCMEKIDYDEEEKPSLKRPEPRPEVSTEKASKENKEKRGNKERMDKVKNSKKVVSEKHDRKLDSKAPGKFNRFDEMQEKPKVKARPHPRPPPVNFSDLMKLAEQKQAQPVVIKTTPKKEKERRPMTQEELDRKQAREERMKSKDYQDWYKYGNNSANKKQSKPENTESPSGGFLRPTQNVIPTESQSKPFSIPRKSDKPSCAKPDKHSTTLVTNRPSDSQSSVSHSVPTSKSKPHPTRPGMIANKPQTMAKYMNSEAKHKSSSPPSSSSRDTSQPRPSSSSSRDTYQPRPSSSSSRDTYQPRPSSSSSSSRGTSSQPRLQTSGGAPVDRTKEGNAWDRLFSRPEYKKMTEPPASRKRKMVIDSEEEDEYDDEMDDFIDDEGEEDLGSVSSMIQKMFGYDKRKYRNDDDDDRNMEVGFREVMKEEARSARLGLQEDLEDIRREQEELRQKALRKKMRK